LTEVSIIIPSKDEGDLLLATVDQVRETTPAETELVIVDDGSTDGSVNGAVHKAADQVLTAGEYGCAGAKNLGSIYADGQYLVFIDGHMRLDPGWLEALIGALDSTPAAALAGPKVSDLVDVDAWECGRRFTNAVPPFAFESNRPDTTEFTGVIPGMCQAFVASTFHRVGRFYPEMIPWGTEDVEISMRLWLMGYEVLAVPSASVGHRFRDAFTEAEHKAAEDAAPEGMLRITLANEMKLPLLHYSPRRIVKALESMNAWTDDGLVDGVYELANTPMIQRDRAEYQATRLRTDAGFFAHFGGDPLTPEPGQVPSESEGVAVVAD